ncbi:uncharacterized protein [Onthophagus taurus]|uniref:uncharacterized protein n=1 Tax=Onthophagus taurus TaxID=166361 RepID=UPI000C201FD0|nr:uncharacterized protein LOC111414534 [Onthophagus taurus]
MATRQNASLNTTTTFVPPTTASLSKAEQDKIDFYNTYDPMTGVRIAATLGGFFGLMVLLVVCKSKSKTERALEDPNIVAAAAAEAEEEERQIEAALQATAYHELNPRRSRKSLDCAGVSPGWIRSTRFSSIGGYSSLMDPPLRSPVKLPCSIDEDSPEERSIYDDFSTYYTRYLDVPRRASNITCSSSGSSYLERRGSSVILGLPAVPPHHQKNRSRRRQSSPLPEHYDYYYPIDIRVTQPTPGGSPCGSERALHDENKSPQEVHQPKLAPLASISSCNSSLGTDYEPSLASDSVFRDECDTDDEIDPFSTDTEDSDTEKGAACCRLPKEERRQRTGSESSSATVAGMSRRSQFNLDIPLADSACRPSLLSLDKTGWSKETLF